MTFAVGVGVGVSVGVGVGVDVGIGTGVGVGVGVGVGAAPVSGCQKPPVTVNWPPLEVFPAAAWPFVPLRPRFAPALVPPPPAITWRDRSNCVPACGISGSGPGSADILSASRTPARSPFRAARSLRTGASALPAMW